MCLRSIPQDCYARVSTLVTQALTVLRHPPSLLRASALCPTLLPTTSRILEDSLSGSRSHYPLITKPALLLGDDRTEDCLRPGHREPGFRSKIPMEMSWIGLACPAMGRRPGDGEKIPGAGAWSWRASARSLSAAGPEPMVKARGHSHIKSIQTCPGTLTTRPGCPMR